jgi:hypothetical protein
VSFNGVPGCSNGLIPVGQECNPEFPGACTSGVCGCDGPNCFCREANCQETGEPCGLTSQCCQGSCLLGDPTVCIP